MRRLSAWLVVLGATLGLAACGGGGLESGASDEPAQLAESGPVEGELTISNWPLYIDKAGGSVDGAGTTLAEFAEETGVDVKYIEDVNDNFEFFGKLRPQLSSGESGGRSIVVVTDYMADIMRKLGYLQDLDKSALPNVEANLIEDLRNPSFDPERTFSVPWQSGMTGIIVRKDLAPDVDSIEDLFDPKYKGKVSFLGDMYDDVTLVMKMQGVDPAEATEEEWNAAIDQIAEAADSGQIRDFTGNAYAGPLAKGDIVAAVGWSGDAVQLQADNPNIEWLPPTEGCNLWSDNMVIPVGAPNTPAALAFMNFVYDPEVQADITEYVNYVSPVAGVRDILVERDPEVGENQLIFPDEAFLEGCTPQAVPDESFSDAVTKRYQSVVTG